MRKPIGLHTAIRAPRAALLRSSHMGPHPQHACISVAGGLVRGDSLSGDRIGCELRSEKLRQRACAASRCTLSH
eukprot:2951780-Prymnesium_polylepis.1